MLWLNFSGIGVVHAQHHQLYVPYAYGAVYAHWLETIFLDVLSFVLANTIAGISVRQGMVLSSLATLKTISDHCGYVFTQDPLGWINGNDAKFHDLHHQTWGLKVSEVWTLAQVSLSWKFSDTNPLV